MKDISEKAQHEVGSILLEALKKAMQESKLSNGKTIHQSLVDGDMAVENFMMGGILSVMAFTKSNDVVDFMSNVYRSLVVTSVNTTVNQYIDSMKGELAKTAADDFIDESRKDYEGEIPSSELPESEMYIVQKDNKA